MTAARGRVGALAALLGGILAASALTSAAAYASTSYTVDNTNHSCSDTGPGTPAQPFCTIAAAAKVAHAGDTVLVNAGTYPGTSVKPANSGTAGSPITFTANPGVTISGGSRAFALSARSYIVISGFTITGTSSYGISVSGGSNVTISGNTESYAGIPISSPAAGIYLSNLSGGLISGNVTHDNSAHGIYLTGTTTGVTVQGNTSYHNAYQYERNANGIDDVAPGNFIIGNVTYANEDTGINIYTGANNTLVANNVTYDNGDHGIDDLNVTGGRIIGNTVYYNCTDGINVEGTSGHYNIENNVSMNNATGAIINPTPIAINPSTGAALLYEPLQPPDWKHRRIRFRPGHDNGQLQPRVPERQGRLVHLGGHCLQQPGRADSGHRAGGERDFRQPAVRQCRARGTSSSPRDHRRSTRPIPSPPASRPPTSWATTGSMTRPRPIPATRPGRTTTAGLTNTSRYGTDEPGRVTNPAG